jgi:hypothetical protein
MALIDSVNEDEGALQWDVDFPSQVYVNKEVFYLVVAPGFLSFSEFIL